MKKILLAAACVAATIGALAQGTVNFSNLPGAIGGAGAPIHDTDGTTGLAGTAFFAQLYAGPDAGSLAPIGAAVNFRTGAGAGFVTAADLSRAIATVAPGATAQVQVRAWRASDGATYDAAVAAGGHYGFSNVFTVATGGSGTPPSLPANLVGLQSFSLIPEPSTIALGALGAAALLLRRRS